MIVRWCYFELDSFSRRAARLSSSASVPAPVESLVKPGPADVMPVSAASASAAAATCFLWASQRAWAAAYCCSQVSRCDSKPSFHSLVSGSKPSGTCSSPGRRTR
ncbi:hypothetical protein BC477_13260 [Clavibacter michiganensis subsp. michiganensis]|uniref:Uncharacterized protein n=1 Tax=Clavibacter michiganensis subsp. michiganensis TaxID=33013 RepID=A0A251XI94_CLAMM|nr:hypothetical protein BC477_13260 [Clavibacter michiganensis subsp. michiganensis]OUE02764.1 hypothetical protein CMMCAS07_12165 [Clavibacter michiganensis subsp. michiganensis]